MGSSNSNVSEYILSNKSRHQEKEHLINEFNNLRLDLNKYNASYALNFFYFKAQLVHQVAYLLLYPLIFKWLDWTSRILV